MSRTRRVYNRQRSGTFVHPYRQVCMGRCPHCRDPSREPRALRRSRTSELHHLLPHEL